MCLQTLWFDAQVRFSIDPKDGRPTAIEVFGDAGQDPVELLVDEYRDFAFAGGQLQFPSRLRLQYGAEPMLLMEVEHIEFDPSGAATASSKEKP